MTSPTSLQHQKILQLTNLQIDELEPKKFMKTELLRRTKELGIKVIFLVDELPNKPSGWAIGKQLVRCATSVGANYRAVCLAKSKADFINKLKIVEEERDETVFWIEVIEEASIWSKDRVVIIKKGSNGIVFPGPSI